MGAPGVLQATPVTRLGLSAEESRDSAWFHRIPLDARRKAARGNSRCLESGSDVGCGSARGAAAFQVYLEDRPRRAADLLTVGSGRKGTDHKGVSRSLQELSGSLRTPVEDAQWVSKRRDR